jgi:hypothetical protein
MSRLQETLKLVGVATLDEEAIGVVSVGQGYAPRGHPLSPETPRHPLRCVLAAPIGVGIESQVDGPRAIAQLLKLSRVELVAHRTGDMVESCLP